jgi:hypothetical protein
MSRPDSPNSGRLGLEEHAPEKIIMAIVPGADARLRRRRHGSTPEQGFQQMQKGWSEG